METPANFIFDTDRVTYGVEVNPRYTNKSNTSDYLTTPEKFQDVVKHHILNTDRPFDHRVNVKLVRRNEKGNLDKLDVTIWITAVEKISQPDVPQPLYIEADGGYFAVTFEKETDILGTFGLITYQRSLEADFTGYMSTNTDKSSGFTTVLLITDEDPDLFFTQPLRASFKFVSEPVTVHEDQKQKRIADFRHFITQLQINGEI